MSAGDSRPPSDSSEPSGGGGTSSSAERPDTDGSTSRSPVNRFLHDQDGPFMFVREVLSSAAIVLAIGLLLFAVAGVWPPMVAVESGSMEPHMERGDLIFITEPGRFAPDAGDGSGVVTYAEGQEANYRSLGSYGSVVVYDNPNSAGPPIIHRAMFRVEAGENWYEKASPDYISADNCGELEFCPAPYDAYITKGDNNPTYDQTSTISAPVREQWVTGVARVRIPYLGWIRLAFASTAPDPTLLLQTAGPQTTPIGQTVSESRALVADSVPTPPATATKIGAVSAA